MLDRDFGYVTPENDFKHSVIHPRPGVWDWEAGDAWIKHCAEQDQVIRLHGPISPQASKWAKADERTPEELTKSLRDFMTALCKRYDGVAHVKWMDVVNETVAHSGEWFMPKEGTGEWENPWPLIGFDETHPLRPPLYIKMAFEIANEHAPNTQLIINQHAGMQDPVWEKIKALVLYLREQNLRVDGIGWQAHLDVGWEKKPGNMERLHALIAWAHDHDLSFHITEKNAWMKRKTDTLEDQANTFAAIFRALLEHRENGDVTWNVWNISDATAWQHQKGWEGCLFDRNFEAKPAYYALQNLLEHPPPPLTSTDGQ